MVVAPCSIHTMSAIAAGISSNLLVRAADVTLKERRRLILMVRETPFHLGHLRSMTALAEMGAIIAPPIPGFYHHPQTVMDLVDHSVDRVLDLLGLPDPPDRPPLAEEPRRNEGLAPAPLDGADAFQGARGAFSEEAARQLLGATRRGPALRALRRRLPQPEGKAAWPAPWCPSRTRWPARSTKTTITC